MDESGVKDLVAGVEDDLRLKTKHLGAEEVGQEHAVHHEDAERHGGVAFQGEPLHDPERSEERRGEGEEPAD